MYVHVVLIMIQYSQVHIDTGLSSPQSVWASTVTITQEGKGHLQNGHT